MSTLRVHARDLADALSNIAPHASSAGDAVVALTQLTLTATTRGLVVAATDRYTIAEQTVPYAGPGEVEGRVLLAAAGVRAVVKKLDGWSKGKPEPTIELDLAGRTLTTDSEVRLPGLQDCEFPLYDSLWPTEPSTIGHPTFALSPQHFLKYTRLRLHGKRTGTAAAPLRIQAGATPTRPLLITSIALANAEVDFRSLLMPVKLASP